MFWKTLFRFMLVQVLFDGFIIYYFYPNVLLHFIKDLVLVVTFLFFMMQDSLKARMDQLGSRLGVGVTTAMAGLFIVALGQIFNPLSPGLARGLLGLKLMFLPWLILPMAYAFADSLEDVEGFAKTSAFCSIPINIFGIIQYLKGPEYMVSTFGIGFRPTIIVAMVPGVSYEESFFRIIGTFATSAIYGQFLMANIMLCFGLFLIKSRPRFLWLPALVLSFFALLGTGSRGTFTTLIVIFFLFSLMLKRGRPILVATLIFGFGFYAAFSFMSPAVTKRFATTLERDNFRGRTYETTGKMFPKILEKYPMGKGVGAASQASRYLGKVQGEFSLIENYASKLQLELGIAGVILFYLFAIFLTIRWREWLRECDYLDENSRVFVAIFSAYCLGVFIAGAFPEIPSTYIFLWPMVGFMARISSLPRQE